MAFVAEHQRCGDLDGGKDDTPSAGLPTQTPTDIGSTLAAPSTFSSVFQCVGKKSDKWLGVTLGHGGRALRRVDHLIAGEIADADSEAFLERAGRPRRRGEARLGPGRTEEWAPREISLCEARGMRRHGWMGTGDAIVRLAWKLLWSWRRP